MSLCIAANEQVRNPIFTIDNIYNLENKFDFTYRRKRQNKNSKTRITMATITDGCATNDPDCDHNLGDA
jgi:hypothetical protein